jgi:demethylmenaquinone methyltransferase/2-methoxy-6-polyprenyl-1,4-benzoquinol methylase
MRDDRSGRAEAARLQALDLEAHLADPAMKQRFVTPMFDVIAPRYDDFTRIFSFGMDRGWKRRLLDDARRVAPPEATVLDLACGTGDLALDLSRLVPTARVIGLDASGAMIDLAERRRDAAQADRVRFAVGDMSALELPSASVDVVTAGYGFRNVPDYRAALAEVARVLRPGGYLLTLDFYRPEKALWRRLVVGYLTIAGSVIGWLWHRAPVVYAYLGPSVSHFVSWQAFSRSLETAEFVVERVSPRLFGAIAMHRARRR